MFNVTAFRKSAITTGENEFQLRAIGQGFAFVNVITANIEMGSYSEDANKFVCLDLFRKISGDMSVRFHLN
jgi:hypothetical protein